MNEKLYIGKIVGTHGLRGEVKIKSISSFSKERFKKGNIIYITINNKDYLELKCATHRVHKNLDLVSFEGLQNINFVEKYRDYEVYGLYDESLLDENEYFYRDVIDCAIYDQNNNLVGKVKSIMQNPLYDILEVVDENSKKILIPYINQFVEEEDIKNKIIKVVLLDGM